MINYNLHLRDVDLAWRRKMVIMKAFILATVLWGPIGSLGKGGNAVWANSERMLSGQPSGVDYSKCANLPVHVDPYNATISTLSRKYDYFKILPDGRIRISPEVKSMEEKETYNGRFLQTRVSAGSDYEDIDIEILRDSKSKNIKEIGYYHTIGGRKGKRGNNARGQGRRLKFEVRNGQCVLVQIKHLGPMDNHVSSSSHNRLAHIDICKSTSDILKNYREAKSFCSKEFRKLGGQLVKIFEKDHLFEADFAKAKSQGLDQKYYRLTKKRDLGTDTDILPYEIARSIVKTCKDEGLEPFLNDSSLWVSTRESLSRQREEKAEKKEILR
ncbi:MAG: hypothetical protein OXB88_03115 [Bacteriovoracales bacterium]|nr:hypothetical protein [Bacteriovoracales bacterium]